MLQGFSRFTRSMPNRRMSVRMPLPKAPPAGSSVHRSFRLTKPVKEKFIKSGFGSYTPEAFKKQLEHKSPKEATTKAEEYFLKHAKSEKALQTSEELKKFARGFMEEAHEEGVKLRGGYNPVGHEREEGERLLKEFQQKNKPPEAPVVDDRAAHMRQMTAMRERLGITHGPISGSTPTVQEPTPLGHGWSGNRAGWSGPQGHGAGTSATHPKPAPSLSGAAQPFLGGHITVPHHPRPDETPAIPAPSVHESTPPTHSESPPPPHVPEPPAPREESSQSEDIRPLPI